MFSHLQHLQKIPVSTKPSPGLQPFWKWTNARVSEHADNLIVIDSPHSY